MRILALIPARGGSKRLPGKNIRPLGGLSLIERSINIAQDLPEICDVLVSTDSKRIANISRNAGALVPWLRPADLATDTSSSVDVALHALNWYEEAFGVVDGLLILQPTSPFRTRERVLQGITKFSVNQRSTVIGVSPAKSHPMWCFKIDENVMSPVISDTDFYLRSQDLPNVYTINGAFYLIRPDELRSLRSFFKSKMIPLVMDQVMESIDIDTELDWVFAEACLEFYTEV